MRKILALIAGLLAAGAMCLGTAGAASAAKTCTVTGSTGICPLVNGYYVPSEVTMSNGYNTLVANNCWAEPDCNYVLTAKGPGDWSVTDPGDEPARSTSVATYPDVGQLTNNWGKGGWGKGGNNTPLTGVSSLRSRFSESFPHNRGTIAEWGYDIWTNYPSDVMIWTDDENRGTGGANRIATDVKLNGQYFNVYRNGSMGSGPEIIFILTRDDGKDLGGYAHESSGAVHILTAMHWLVSFMNRHGHAKFATQLNRVGAIDAGWEICSTGGSSETFSVSGYTLKGVVKK